MTMKHFAFRESVPAQCQRVVATSRDGKSESETQVRIEWKRRALGTLTPTDTLAAGGDGMATCKPIDMRPWRVSGDLSTW